jgi:hypothetical protein
MFKHGEVEDKPEEGQLFYEIDGKKVFEVRNEAGQVVGYRMFILFKD